MRNQGWIGIRVSDHFRFMLNLVSYRVGKESFAQRRVEVGSHLLDRADFFGFRFGRDSSARLNGLGESATTKPAVMAERD